ncbi:Mut7-C RNAse domain-containing protein [Nitrococcus mobilis]|uniref:Mut7-C RNAse domain-containing protein n=1 Tax=Nitrococcus mobilis Nb-231 TaxID=314278 RepID=A4BNJ4_9GAMM|nr:Mut7-C RNAse domain-containing protein [Nitrococcus mobilis]EAR22793.1 hypothetical protein NB231_10083 [Nitrococcus mobilis Nb-231]
MIRNDTAQSDRPEAPTIGPPTSDSSEGPRFLCDRMLIRLCRWLRAAGYDTSLAGERTSDHRLLTTAVVEQRYLLTRDRKLLEHRGAAGRVIRLQAVRPAGQAAELAQRLSLDWLHAPFSRCLLCNAPLHVDSGHGAPPGSHGPFRRCPSCARRYWDGGHVRRMRAQLTTWRHAASTGMHRADESFIL